MTDNCQIQKSSVLRHPPDLSPSSTSSTIPTFKNPVYFTEKRENVITPNECGMISIKRPSKHPF